MMFTRMSDVLEFFLNYKGDIKDETRNANYMIIQNIITNEFTLQMELYYNSVMFIFTDLVDDKNIYSGSHNKNEDYVNYFQREWSDRVVVRINNFSELLSEEQYFQRSLLENIPYTYEEVVKLNTLSEQIREKFLQLHGISKQDELV